MRFFFHPFKILRAVPGSKMCLFHLLLFFLSASPGLYAQDISDVVKKLDAARLLPEYFSDGAEAYEEYDESPGILTDRLELMPFLLEHILEADEIHYPYTAFLPDSVQQAAAWWRSPVQKRHGATPLPMDTLLQFVPACRTLVGQLRDAGFINPSTARTLDLAVQKHRLVHPFHVVVAAGHALFLDGLKSAEAQAAMRDSLVFLRQQPGTISAKPGLASLQAFAGSFKNFIPADWPEQASPAQTVEILLKFMQTRYGPAEITAVGWRLEDEVLTTLCGFRVPQQSVVFVFTYRGGPVLEMSCPYQKSGDQIRVQPRRLLGNEDLLNLMLQIEHNRSEESVWGMVSVDPDAAERSLFAAAGDKTLPSLDFARVLFGDKKGAGPAGIVCIGKEACEQMKAWQLPLSPTLQIPLLRPFVQRNEVSMNTYDKVRCLDKFKRAGLFDDFNPGLMRRVYCMISTLPVRDSVELLYVTMRANDPSLSESIRMVNALYADSIRGLPFLNMLQDISRSVFKASDFSHFKAKKSNGFVVGLHYEFRGVPYDCRISDRSHLNEIIESFAQAWRKQQPAPQRVFYFLPGTRLILFLSVNEAIRLGEEMNWVVQQI